MIKDESREYFRALGAHVPVLRKEQGISQAKLSRLLGVSQQSVFAYELGQRRITVLLLAKPAKIFEVPAETLMGMTIPVSPKRRLSAAAIRHVEGLQRLRKTEQRFVKRIIDIFLQRSGPGVSRAPDPKSSRAT